VLFQVRPKLSVL